MTAKAHYSAAELAAMKLPGLPGTEQNIRAKADVEQWEAITVKARGRTGTRKEYPLAALPAEARKALLASQINTLSSGAEPSAPLPAVGTLAAGLSIPVANSNHLTDKQRLERDARKAVLTAIKHLQAQTRCSQEAAMTTLVTTARAGKLETGLDNMLRLARDARGRAGDGYPSVRTLKRWLAAPDLAPKVSTKDMTVPPWAPALMKLYGQPQKPSLAQCMEELPKTLERGITAPSYDAARRFLTKMGAVEKQRGRRLSREIKNILPFVRRDTSEMLPGDCYTADGHTFDAEIAHPKHGRAFRPELTSVLDIATKKCVGWSAGLAESTWAVMDAQRHAFETHGICALWYVDNGSGYRNAMQADEVVGFAARLGTTITHSLPYNSQARGIEERSHQSIWVRGAKTLPTYMGKDMDPQARQKVFKLTRKHIRETGTSPLLMAWDRFLVWCVETVAAYNARPHKGLPKFRDAEGKSRHMSPNEAWEAAIAAGWEPVRVTDGERDDLFRPYTLAKVLRGEIRLFNNLYFSHDLTEYHGEQVRVGYDIHNPAQVWVRDEDGRLICTAQVDGNRHGYFPQSVIEQADIKRAKGREKRLETHLQEVRDELNAPALLENSPVGLSLDLQIPQGLARKTDEVAVIAPEVAHPIAQTGNVVALPSAEPRPWFNNDPDQYRWLMKNPAQWGADDADWLLDYVASEDYLDLAERYAYQGVAWSENDARRAMERIEGYEVAAR